MTNKSRLKLLQQREEHLQDLFATARSSIVELSAEEGRYVQFLENVAVQGFLSLLEPEVTVHTREKDVEIAERAVENAKNVYTEISGRTVKTSVNGSLSNDLYVSCSLPALCLLKAEMQCWWCHAYQRKQPYYYRQYS